MYYHDNPSWRPGDVRDISKEQAEYLTATFPNNFIVVKSETEPPLNRAEKAPKKNR